MNYIIVLDIDRPDPFLVTTLFATLADAKAYVIEYMPNRAHRIVPIPAVI